MANCWQALFSPHEDFYLRQSNAGQWIIIGRLSVRPLQSSQESIYRPEKHGNIGI